MAEKQAKRPAHEVIMEALTDRCATLKMYQHPEGPTSARLRQTALEQIEILCWVLERMIIPEEHRGAIVTMLHNNRHLHAHVREAADRLAGW